MNNKQPKPTFAQKIRLQLIVAAIGFLAALALSLSYITLRTVDFTDVKMTILAAESLVKRLDSDPSAKLPTDQNMMGYTDWNNIPNELKKPFETMQLDYGELTETTYINNDDEEVYIAILPMLRQNGDTIYFISEYGFDESNDVYTEIFNNFLIEAIWLLIFIFTFLFLFVFWLLKRATEPMYLLSDWAQGLKNGKGLTDADFAIAEVDDLAKQLKQGVDRLTAYNEREKRFLKYASHELRTPQATVQACLDTLQLQLTGAKLKTVERALRANLNMSRLSSALLWLSRETSDPVKKSDVNIVAICNQLIAENKHLIDSKALIIKVNANIDTLYIEQELLTIVFSNLFRNACQHAQEGEVVLNIEAEELSITNSICQNELNDDIESFGLGLHLVNSICDKLNWRFSYTETEEQATAKLSW